VTPGTASIRVTRGNTKVAGGRLVVGRAGLAHITVRVTRKGRALLRSHRRLRLRLTVSFAPRDGGPVAQVTARFTVRRR
jgi:hypothetical protein